MTCTSAAADHTSHLIQMATQVWYFCAAVFGRCWDLWLQTMLSRLLCFHLPAAASSAVLSWQRSSSSIWNEPAHAEPDNPACTCRLPARRPSLSDRGKAFSASARTHVMPSGWGMLDLQYCRFCLTGQQGKRLIMLVMPLKSCIEKLQAGPPQATV